MPQMKATKSLTYGTRRLKADDIFMARTRTDARVLIALKKAEPYSRDKKKIVPVDPRKATMDDTHVIVTTKPKAAPRPKAAAKPKRAARAKITPA